MQRFNSVRYALHSTVGLFSNRIQSSSHCLSHLFPPEKHRLGHRPRGHRYTPPFAQTIFANPLFIPRSLFSFLWFLHIQCLIYSVLYYCITFAFVICLIRDQWKGASFLSGELENNIVISLSICSTVYCSPLHCYNLQRGGVMVGGRWTCDFRSLGRGFNSLAWHFPVISEKVTAISRKR